MAAESLNALALSDVPQLARAVNTARETVVASKVELAATQLTRMAFERMDALTRADIPNLGGVVKGRGE